MVPYNSQDGNPPFKAGSPTIQNLVTHQPEEGCPPSNEVTHCPKDMVAHHPHDQGFQLRGGGGLYYGGYTVLWRYFPPFLKIELETLMMITLQQYKAYYHQLDHYYFPQHSHPPSSGWPTRLGV